MADTGTEIKVKAVQIGIPGKDGRGIADITEEASEVDEGLNLIRILMTDGSYYDLTVRNGSGTVGPAGPAGEAGTGIESVTVDTDGCLHITLTDGSEVVTESLKGERGSQGETGPAGPQGSAGNGIASAVLNADYTLTLTFTDGTSYTTGSLRGARGEAGRDGQDGAAGQDGSTPVRGVDYWTAADQAAIVAAVVAQFTDGDSASYGGE